LTPAINENCEKSGAKINGGRRRRVEEGMRKHWPMPRATKNKILILPWPDLEGIGKYNVDIL
jgi:hypothetical protein